ncbi:uncharacterized protein LOC121761499 isoform X2 [Salvia splendens]|uniref:uncharacterized protein LOC121761499 isoform X2 n=1 Tax=Salvia splendens TaxID=180675 RepID=UPI001C270586|nr:uncharacterized protein LOC121761499 isoform X2 [Salvia splendens]
MKPKALNVMFQIKLVYPGSESNASMLTLGGVDAMGKRLADEICIAVVYKVRSLSNHEPPVSIVSLFYSNHHHLFKYIIFSQIGCNHDRFYAGFSTIYKGLSPTPRFRFKLTLHHLSYYNI